MTVSLAALNISLSHMCPGAAPRRIRMTGDHGTERYLILEDEMKVPGIEHIVHI
jgi:hypothetical protein